MIQASSQILEPTEQNMAQVIKALNAGDVVGVPSETVYGLGGDALNSEALLKIYRVKERPTFDPLIVHICSSIQELESQGIISLKEFSAKAAEGILRLTQRFWPGPLTLVLPRGPNILDLVTSGLDTVAVRMPRHPVFLDLIKKFGKPIAAPSANQFGRISPTTAVAVQSELGERISLILDGGPCEIGLESTILKVESDGSGFLLRPGEIAQDAIEEVLRTTLKDATHLQNTSGAQLAPGLLKHHYAPRKQLFLTPSPYSQMSKEDWNNFLLQIGKERPENRKGIGLLFFQKPGANELKIFSQLLGQNITTYILSESGSLEEAASSLFREMRKMDEGASQTLIAEPPHTTTGIGYAILDRLWRASRPR